MRADHAGTCVHTLGTSLWKSGPNRCADLWIAVDGPRRPQGHGVRAHRRPQSVPTLDYGLTRLNVGYPHHAPHLVRPLQLSMELDQPSKSARADLGMTDRRASNRSTDQHEIAHDNAGGGDR